MKGSDKKVIFQGVHQMMGSDLGPKWAPGERKTASGLYRHRPAQGNPAAGPGGLPRFGIFLAIGAPSGEILSWLAGTSWLQSARLFGEVSPASQQLYTVARCGYNSLPSDPARRPT